MLPVRLTVPGRGAGRVVEDDALLAAGLEFAESAARKSPLALANAKRVMATAWEQRLPLDDRPIEVQLVQERRGDVVLRGRRQIVLAVTLEERAERRFATLATELAAMIAAASTGVR